MSADRPTQADLRVRLSRGARGAVAATIAAMAASLLTQVWLARRAGPAGLGEYNATSLFVIVVTTVLVLGLPFAISERLAAREETARADAAAVLSGAVGLVLALAFVAALLSVGTWPAFVELTHLERPAPLVLIPLAAAAAVAQAIAVAVLLAQLRTGTATVVVVAQPFAVGCGLLVSYAIPSLTGSTLAVTGFLASGLVSTAVLVALGVAPRISGTEARHLIGRAVPNTTLLYFTLLIAWIDRLVILLLLGAASLGTYAVASFLTEAVLRVPRNVGSFGVSAYARLGDDAAGIRRVVDSQMRLVSAFFLIVGCALFAGADGLLVQVFGPGFRAAATPLRLLAAGLVPTGVVLALTTSAASAGRDRRLVAGLALLPPLQLVLAVIGVLTLSITGVALASLALWLVAAALFLVPRPGRPVPPAFETVAIVTAAVVPTYVATLLVAGLALPWGVRAAIGAILALVAAQVALVGPPERRILRRLLGISTR